MSRSIEEAIQIVKENIAELEERIAVLESLDITNVDEYKWHQICETPLRTSDILCDILKNIFPEAENIRLGCNEIAFQLKGFDVAIPTSRVRGIEIDIGWYRRDRGEPERIPENIYRHNHKVYEMYKYFEALDNHADWWTLARRRMRYPLMKPLEFFRWHFYIKWKNPHRDDWEKLFEEDRQRFEKRVQNYHKEREEMHERAKEMKELLSELSVFSTETTCHYKNGFSSLTVGEILKLEGLDDK